MTQTLHIRCHDRRTGNEAEILVAVVCTDPKFAPIARMMSGNIAQWIDSMGSVVVEGETVAAVNGQKEA